MRSSNPILNRRFADMARASSGSGTMSINGTIDKAVIMFFLMLITATFTWNRFLDQSAPVHGLMMLGLIGGLIAAMVTIFKPTLAPISAPIYALLEGLALGGISASFNYMAPGLPMQAVGLTFAVLIVMLTLYRTRIIVVTQKLRSGIIAATGAVFLFYISLWILSFFGVNTSIMSNGSMLGIGLSLVIIGIAAFNLLLDFDFIENASAQGYPAYMNWVGALGLMVTLVWLYLEILRLLSRTRD